MVNRVLTMEKINDAARHLDGIAYHTPLYYSNSFSKMSGARVYIKLENMQKTGSFKIRGAYNKVMSLVGVGCHGVIAASAGNHAQGVAYAAARAGLPCTIVMPSGAPISKIVATQSYGARVVLAAGGYDDAYNHAVELQGKNGATLVHSFNDLEVMAGQATIALELLKDIPDIGAIVVPIGGGGLIAGVSYALKHLRPCIRVIGVQAAGAPAVYLSTKKSLLVETEATCTFADGIAVRRPGTLTFPIIQEYVDEIVTVDDEEIAGAILMLLERSKIVAEGAGAAGLAALLYRKVSLADIRTVALLSGGNIDVNILSMIIERGLAKTGRYVRMRALIKDQPGNLGKLLTLLASTRTNVISVLHDRIKPNIPLKQAEVELVLETRDKKHIDEIVLLLAHHDYTPTVIS